MSAGPIPSRTIDLTDQFLIAMPGMRDDNFSGTVVYLCEHNANGALGLVRGWFPTLLGYSAQGACKFGFYEYFKKGKPLLFPLPDPSFPTQT